MFILSAVRTWNQFFLSFRHNICFCYGIVKHLMKQRKWQAFTQKHLSRITPTRSGLIFNIPKCTIVKRKHVASLARLLLLLL
jgi:hypothetical protein